MLRLIFIINLSFLFTFLTAQHAYTGSVSDGQGNPLQGALVYVNDGFKTAVTDLEGQFYIQNLKPGNYKLNIQYLGFDDMESTIRIPKDQTAEYNMRTVTTELKQVNIIANKLTKDSPFSYQEVNKEDIKIKNLVQDLPFLIEHTPSMVVTSDAGAGVGYTGLRLRGSDATRINVTINGVPLNDSESQGVFWVNLPDFGSSVENVQIQRGVGSSTNGAAAFGGTVALNTNKSRTDAYGKVSSAFGSYNTDKLSVEAGTGSLAEHFVVEGRYSVINSDGYVDRATSDLDSWSVSAAAIGDKSSLRLNVFSGDERTYQSWFGVPEARITGNENDLFTHYFNNVGVTYNTVADSLNLFNSDRRYNYYLYQDQVDDYGQDHVQLIYNQQINSTTNFNTTLHYTKGQGFFEEFRFQDALIEYNITNPEGDADLVRRRWLDNDFYGIITNITFQANDNIDLLGGFGLNRYDGDHFGEVIDVFSLPNLEEQQPYYFSDASKTDFNVYGKINYQLNESLLFYGDLQWRAISYETEGIDNDLIPIDVDENYNFFNPKFGLTYKLNNESQFYASYARANREPVRSDFIDAIGTQIPKPETLNDLEFGFRTQSPTLAFEANAYYMLYSDQLVLTGAVNDVGGGVRTNVDDSFRRGIELSLSWSPTSKISWSPNLTLSQNKIDQYTDVIVDFADFSFVETIQNDTDIAFSPSVIAGSRLQYKLLPYLAISLQSKYVGDQFLDNTSNDFRVIDAYFVNDFIVDYSLKELIGKEISIKFLVNNILNETYESNGYTFSYIFGDLVTENYYYPQAGTNVLLGLTVEF